MYVCKIYILSFFDYTKYRKHINRAIILCESHKSLLDGLSKLSQ